MKLIFKKVFIKFILDIIPYSWHQLSKILSSVLWLFWVFIFRDPIADAWRTSYYLLVNASPILLYVRTRSGLYLDFIGTRVLE